MVQLQELSQRECFVPQTFRLFDFRSRIPWNVIPMDVEHADYGRVLYIPRDIWRERSPEEMRKLFFSYPIQVKGSPPSPFMDGVVDFEYNALRPYFDVDSLYAFHGEFFSCIY